MSKRGRPAKANPDQLVRFQVKLDRPTQELFAVVQDALHASSQADALRQSVRLMKWFLERRAEGYRVVLERDGQLREVDMLL